eukprot:jgi/Psemu1/22397/gm1.22397_g
MTMMVSEPTLSQSQMKVDFKVYPSQVKDPTIFQLKVVLRLQSSFIQVKAISVKDLRLLIELMPSLKIQVDPNKSPAVPIKIEPTAYLESKSNVFKSECKSESFSLQQRAFGFLSKSEFKSKSKSFSLQGQQAFGVLLPESIQIQVATIAFTFLFTLLGIHEEAGNIYSNLGDDVDNHLSFFHVYGSLLLQE